MPQPRPYKVALNGYGRIGRCVLRALFERGAAAGFEIVAINDLADMASIEYLTRFDSTHGRFPGEVRIDGDCLHINGNCVKVLRSATPEGIDWAALGVDVHQVPGGDPEVPEELGELVEHVHVASPP